MCLLTLSVRPLTEKLNAAGYRTTHDILSSTPVQVSEDLGISHQKALDVIMNTEKEENNSATTRSKNGGLNKLGKSALDLLNVRKESVFTFCEEIDKTLFGGGGVPVGQMTEFCGVPGVGKTQMAMQLAVDVQVPQRLGGVGGSCVYIDTEGSLMVERLEELAASAIEHLRRLDAQITATKAPAKPLDPRVFSVESYLKNIHVFRVHDYAEQLAAVQNLPSFLSLHRDVKLIVVDSVAFHFRHGFDDMANRSRMLSKMSQDLNKMASDFKLAIVVVNQVTTKFVFNKPNGAGGKSKSAVLVPALGESWSHAATNRVELFWSRGIRQARLVKSPSQKLNTVAYAVTPRGIRGVKRVLSENNKQVVGVKRAASEINDSNERRQPSVRG